MRERNFHFSISILQFAMLLYLVRNASIENSAYCAPFQGPTVERRVARFGFESVGVYDPFAMGIDDSHIGRFAQGECAALDAENARGNVGEF